MENELSPWRSPSGERNAVWLRAHYAEGLEAIAEFDRIGHLLLHKTGSKRNSGRMEEFVGIALLRRAVTLFEGIRILLESSSVDSVKPLARALFELWMGIRCIAYGSAQPITLHTPTTHEEREPRARRYFVASERRNLRTRALMLQRDSPFPPDSPEGERTLRQELSAEMERLKKDYPEEWAYFGDITEKDIVRRVASSAEPPWFAKEFEPESVRSIRALAKAFDDEWVYEFLYDVFSGMVHTRGLRQDVTIGEGTIDVHHPRQLVWFETLAYWTIGWYANLLMAAAKWQAPEMVTQLQTLHLRLQPNIRSLEPNSFPNMLS